jgi:hypothetical protein
VSFTSYGSAGTPIAVEGGVLIHNVKAFPVGSTPVKVGDFTVTCVFGTPPAGAEEGVTIPSLGATMPVDEPGRFTLFIQV